MASWVHGGPAGIDSAPENVPARGP